MVKSRYGRRLAVREDGYPSRRVEVALMYCTQYRRSAKFFSVYKRTRRAALLGEFLRLSSEVDIRITQERNSFIHRHLTDALDANKDIWKEMRNVSLLPKRKEEDLNGSTPGELNARTYNQTYLLCRPHHQR